MCHPEGNSNRGWQRGVFPLYMTWRGRKLPKRLPQKTAVIWRLSLVSIISTCCTLFWSIVQEEQGTNFIPVWSQLRMSSPGISSIVTKKRTFSSTQQSWQQCACFWLSWFYASSSLEVTKPSAWSTESVHQIQRAFPCHTAEELHGQLLMQSWLISLHLPHVLSLGTLAQSYPSSRQEVNICHASWMEELKQYCCQHFSFFALLLCTCLKWSALLIRLHVYPAVCWIPKQLRRPHADMHSSQCSCIQRDCRPGMIHASAVSSYLWLFIPAGLLQLLLTMVFQMKEAL